MVHRYHLLRVRNGPLALVAVVDIRFLHSSKRHSKSHTLCRRCGNRSFHKQHKGAFLGSTILSPCVTDLTHYLPCA